MDEVLATGIGSRRRTRQPGSGSHRARKPSRTQPRGGKFDGVLARLVGWRALHSIFATGYETHAPIVVVHWWNEEAAAFLWRGRVGRVGRWRAPIQGQRD